MKSLCGQPPLSVLAVLALLAIAQPLGARQPPARVAGRFVPVDPTARRRTDAGRAAVVGGVRIRLGDAVRLPLVDLDAASAGRARDAGREPPRRQRRPAGMNFGQMSAGALHLHPRGAADRHRDRLGARLPRRARRVRGGTAPSAKRRSRRARSAQRHQPASDVCHDQADVVSRWPAIGRAPAGSRGSPAGRPRGSFAVRFSTG